MKMRPKPRRARRASRSPINGGPFKSDRMKRRELLRRAVRREQKFARLDTE